MHLPSKDGEYFPFGQDVERIKMYVRQQLNGDETRKNQEILRQFQRETEARKHNYMNKHRFSINDKTSKFEPKRYQTLEVSNSENYIQNPKNRYPLIPADKKRPPIYKYMQGMTSGQGSVPAGLNHHTPNRYFHEQSSSKRQFRGNSLQVDGDNHRSWALQKIKESALKKREKDKTSTISKAEPDFSDEQYLINQLEKEQERSLMQYENLSRKLKKLKKYRIYIKQHQRGGL